ncbi:molybdate ABC transporter substrate-binding protein [Flagellimonas sp. S174]|uniref:molybdate ABC transporter substrate-binding protein n=1 Tax=Flagellimonas sp. S174 TaxID=3410790 RepID=UPI003BF52ED3
MKSIADSFSNKTNIDCELILGSSGKLTAQIQQGAPYDVFISADIKYPEELHRTQKTEGKPKIYAEGKLVLWTVLEELTPSLPLLQTDTVQHIAIANPKTAPYGVAALAVLRGQPFYESVVEKLVYGESIAQTNQFITSKSAEIGFTSMAVVLSAEMKNKGHWIALAEEAYPRLLQSASLIKKENGASNEALAFYDFLFSQEAQKILRLYGYSIPN